MARKKTNILLVDDHQMFSDGIKQLLEKEASFNVIGQIYDGTHVLYNVALLVPDLILLDINLPKINGLEIAKKIVEDFPKIKVIMLSMFNDPALITQAKKIGVQGYILKNSSSEKLISGIESVISNNNYFDQDSNNFIIEDVNYNSCEIMKTFQLTARELEILRFIKLGMSSKQISEKVNLSYLTIKTHRRNIHFKLKTETTAELIRFAMENEL